MAVKTIDKELATKQGEMKKLEQEIKDLRKLKDENFRKFCEKPEIKASAMKAVVAMDELHREGLSITDWCMGVNRVEVELEDNEEGTRNWIIIHV